MRASASASRQVVSSRPQRGGVAGAAGAVAAAGAAAAGAAAAAARPRAEPLHRAHLRLARAAHNALVRLASYPFDPRAWSLEPGSPDLLFGSFLWGRAGGGEGDDEEEGDE